MHIELQAPLIHLEDASVQWFKDGRLLSTAPGATSVDVVAGALGSRAEVVAQIRSSEGIDAQADILIIPTRLDLLYEADTYVAPLYRGRALATGPRRR